MVAKKISKLPSRRALQKNHAQLHNFSGKSLLKFSRRQNFKIFWVENVDEVGGLARKFQSYPLGEPSRKIMLNFKIRNEDGGFCKNLWRFVTDFFFIRFNLKVISFIQITRIWILMNMEGRRFNRFTRNFFHTITF